MENVHVVMVYDCLDVLHAAVTYFDFISVEYLVRGVFFWEMISISCRKDWPILVVTLLLYGRLNHITFRWRFLFLLCWLLVLGGGGGGGKLPFLGSLLYLMYLHKK